MAKEARAKACRVRAGACRNRPTFPSSDFASPRASPAPPFPLAPIIRDFPPDLSLIPIPAPTPHHLSVPVPKG